MQMSIPIASVPVGLGAMQTDRAFGALTISDSYTYGVPMVSAYEQLIDWHGKENQKRDHGILKSLGENAKRARIYVRVVTRVYLAGSLVATMFNANVQGAAAAGGAGKEPSPVALGDTSTSAANSATMASAAQALNNTLSGLPGGSIHVVQASSRCVTLTEVFDQPLVIGYLGFDVPVKPSGDLDFDTVFILGRQGRLDAAAMKASLIR
jgi:hypothetical protein